MVIMNITVEEHNHILSLVKEHTTFTETGEEIFQGEAFMKGVKTLFGEATFQEMGRVKNIRMHVIKDKEVTHIPYIGVGKSVKRIRY